MNNQQKLQSYKLLIDVAKKNTSTMESDSILQYILGGIVSVLPYVDKAILYLYEEDKDMLKMVATHNIEFADAYPYLKRGESVSGKCFEKRDCVALNGKGSYAGYMDRLSTYFKSFPEDDKEYPYSSMTCCLMVENRPVGVVTVYNYIDENYAFTEDDLELLSAAADHAAITISKSQLIKQMNYYLRQLEENNKSLADSLEMQSKFTQIILNHNGFGHILEYLKTVINHEVYLYDLFSQLIYTTAGEEHAPSLPGLVDQNTLMDMVNHGNYDKISYHQNESLYVIKPVIVHTHLIAFLMVDTRQKPFGKKEEAILNHASLVVALEWLKSDAKTKSFSDRSNQLLDLLLHNPADTAAPHYAEELGLPLDGHYCMTIVKQRGIHAPEVNNELIINLGLKNVVNILKNAAVKGLVFHRDEHLHILFYFPADCEEKAQALEEVEDAILALDEHLKIVRGGIYPCPDKIKKSYDEALLCLKMLGDYHISRRKIDYAGLGIWQLLLKLEKADLERYACQVLNNLLKERTEKNRELFLTLRSYAANNKNSKACAKELGLHLNTIYFRIKKIEDLLGLDLNQEVDWLNVQLACAILSRCDAFFYREEQA